MQLSFK